MIRQTIPVTVSRDAVADFIRNLFMFSLGVVTHRSAISVTPVGGNFGEFPGDFVSLAG